MNAQKERKSFSEDLEIKEDRQISDNNSLTTASQPVSSLRQRKSLSNHELEKESDEENNKIVE